MKQGILIGEIDSKNGSVHELKAAEGQASPSPLFCSRPGALFSCGPHTKLQEAWLETKGSALTQQALLLFSPCNHANSFGITRKL
jgi:hypothetical protein